MTNLVFIEDIFLHLFDTLDASQFSFQKQDRSAAISFYNTILVGQKLTQNQANYVLRLLDKYKNVSATHGFDYHAELANPQWKNPFRVIDMSRKVFVETDPDGCPWICLQFPFQLKKEFETEILSNPQFEGRDFGNIWDKDRRLRMLSMYEYNVIAIFQFVQTHNFEIDETFYDAVAAVEEIWQNQHTVNHECMIEDGKVKLINANNDSLEWFEQHSNGNITNDLLLAKSMGYYFNNEPTNKAQKIAGTKTTTFYTGNYTDLFEICSEVDGKVCIILDRAANAQEWLKNLLTYIDSNNLQKDLFKVCFRASNKEDPEFNTWVKENGLGGKVDEGKYLIFQHKPAKWLFSNSTDVKILVTNNLYPSTNPLTKQWISTHPCVIYFDAVKPSSRSTDIVEL